MIRSVTEMKKSDFSRVLALFFSTILLISSLSGCRMNLPDTKGIGPDGNKEGTEAAAEDEVETDDESAEILFEDDADSNQDVTAGTVEDGDYSMSAYINDQTYVYVDAVETVLKEKSPKKAVDIKDKAGDLNKARLAYLTSYYEGDEESAKEDLEEYEVGPLTDNQKKAMQALYPELGKIFAQFDITNYDMSAPSMSDETYVEYDVYSSDNEPFLIDFTFDDENTISEIDVSYDGELE